IVARATPRRRRRGGQTRRNRIRCRDRGVCWAGAVVVTRALEVVMLRIGRNGRVGVLGTLTAVAGLAAATAHAASIAGSLRTASGGTYPPPVEGSPAPDGLYTASGNGQASGFTSAWTASFAPDPFHLSLSGDFTITNSTADSQLFSIS